MDYRGYESMQRGIASRYSEETPSRRKHPRASYLLDWLYADVFKEGYPVSTPKSGKWLIFISRESVDEVWSKIRNATHSGFLGHKSKVSMPRHLGSTSHVICVYTYDWEDITDVMRIRDYLRCLGITRKIPYKTDFDTLSGKYSSLGHKGISKYYV